MKISINNNIGIYENRVIIVFTEKTAIEKLAGRVNFKKIKKPYVVREDATPNRDLS